MSKDFTVVGRLAIQNFSISCVRGQAECRFSTHLIDAFELKSNCYACPATHQRDWMLVPGTQPGAALFTKIKNQKQSAGNSRSIT
jgi:hypothetical protein